MANEPTFIGDSYFSDTVASMNSAKTSNLDSAGNNSLSGNPMQLQKSGIFTDDFNAFINLPSTVITPAFGSLGIIDQILTTIINYTEMYTKLKNKVEKLSDIVAIFSVSNAADVANGNDARSRTEAYRRNNTRQSIYAHMALSEQSGVV